MLEPRPEPKHNGAPMAFTAGWFRAWEDALLRKSIVKTQIYFQPPKNTGPLNFNKLYVDKSALALLEVDPELGGFFRDSESKTQLRSTRLLPPEWSRPWSWNRRVGWEGWRSEEKWRKPVFRNVVTNQRRATYFPASLGSGGLVQVVQSAHYRLMRESSEREWKHLYGLKKLLKVCRAVVQRILTGPATCWWELMVLRAAHVNRRSKEMWQDNFPHLNLWW